MRNTSKMGGMEKLLDTSVNEVGPNGKNLMDSLKQANAKNKQPFFDGGALPYAKERMTKAKLK